MTRARSHPYPDLHQQLLAAGYTHRRTGSGHHLYTHPGRRAVAMPHTPSDRRARRNAAADVRRSLRSTP